jgi:hypothetical protein
MERFRLYSYEKEMKSIPAKIFFIVFTCLNAYSVICILAVYFFKVHNVIFLPGYIVAVLFIMGTPVVGLIYCALYFTYRYYKLFRYQKYVFLFNFAYLLFLLIAAVYTFIYFPSA